MKNRGAIYTAVLVLLAGFAAGRGQAEEYSPQAPLLKGLGMHQHRVSTREPWAQRFFDQGLVLAYGFNHAEAVYREDLRQYPANGWSLWGLYQALQAQKKDAEAGRVKGQFEQSWKHADIALVASRL